MRRRLEHPGTFNVWPAFTDVLGGLVVVLVFLITIFVISEVLIGREITGKDTAIGQLQRIIDHLELLAGEASEENRELLTQIGGLQSIIDERDTSLGEVRAELVTVQQSRTELAVANTELQDARRDAERKASTIQEQAALLSARSERLANELARLTRALLSGEEQLVAVWADLAEKSTELLDAANRIGQLEAEMQAREDSIKDRDSVIEVQQSRIEAMDGLIKRRLLERVEELEKYASDFFGRLREVFAGNPDIKVVGDRFVFQSEVLFPSGEATLSPAGRGDLDKFVAVYRQLAADLPEDLPVIIEVQGHTDRVPIRTARFSSNWQLSTQRALDVVDYLIQQGIPPEHVAAVGMGEYHPIDTGDTPEAYRRNRRIELKITSR
jgi:chemotaxis protein MotB